MSTVGLIFEVGVSEGNAEIEFESNDGIVSVVDMMLIESDEVISILVN